MGPLFNCLALLGSCVRFDNVTFHFFNPYTNLDFITIVVNQEHAVHLLSQYFVHIYL